MDGKKETKDEFKSIRNLYEKYEEDKESFKEYDDEEMTDKTEYFLMEISEEANNLFASCMLK